MRNYVITSMQNLFGITYFNNYINNFNMTHWKLLIQKSCGLSSIVSLVY